MATTFKFVDPDDLSTTVLDLNALGAAPSGTGFGYFDLDLGGLDPQLEWLRNEGDQNLQIYRGNPYATMAFRLYAVEDDYDSLNTLISSLADVLQTEGIIKWQPTTAAAARYYETYPSPVPALLRRETLLWQILNQGTDPIGIPVTVYRHPLPRYATVTGTPATLSNAVTDREIAVSNTGNRDGEAKVTITPTAGNVAAVRFGVRAEGNLTEFSTLYSFAASGATMKVDTSSSAVPDATSGSAAVTTFATQATMGRRLRKVITPSDATALEGTHRVYLRTRPIGSEVTLATSAAADDIIDTSTAHGYSADDRVVFTSLTGGTGLTANTEYYVIAANLAANTFQVSTTSGGSAVNFTTDITAGKVRRVSGGSEYKAQLRSGFTTDDIVMISNDVVEMDWRDVDSQGFTEIDLGLITVPEGAAQLVLDFWASQESGDQNLATDQLILIPAQEQFCTVSVPGFRMGSWGRERFDADELDGTGTLVRGTYRLNASGEIGRTFPTAGFAYPAGIHTFIADVSLRNDPGASIEVAKMEVYETTTAQVVKSLTLRTKKNQLWTHHERKLNWSVSAGDVIAGKKYVLRVRQTSTASGRRTQIHDFTHKFLQTVTSSNSIIIDSLNRRAYVETSTAAAFPLVMEGEWPMAPPGGSRWVFQIIDAPTDPGYMDLDEREVVGKSVLARAASVQIDTSPRGTH